MASDPEEHPPDALARMRESIRDVLERYRVGEQGALTPRQRAWATPLQIVVLTAREIARDGIVQRASSLTFFTVLSLVPLLSVATALLGAFGVFDPVEGDMARYLRTLFPAAGHGMAEYLQEFSTRGASSIGGLNGVVLLVISIFLFNSIERAMTYIWHGAHNRSIVSKFLMFYTMITLGPILLILSIIQTASAQLFLDTRLGIDTGFVNQFLPFVYALVVFTLMNKILPNVHVRWRSALLAGVVTAAAFELAKWGFNQYINVVIEDSYNRLYGALGAVPIFMLWVYVTWMVILVGSEIAYCYQHMTRLLRLDTPLEETLFEGAHRASRLFDALICLDVLAPIARAYDRGDGPIGEGRVGIEAGYDAGVVREVTDRLIADGALIVTGKERGGARLLMPARPLEDIDLAELVERFLVPPGYDTVDEVATLRDRHREELRELLRGRSARALTAREGASSCEE